MVTTGEFRSFAIRFFETLGAVLSMEGGFLRVELTPDQLAELEGRVGPRPFWEVERNEQTVLYLAFDQKDAATDPRAELVCPGSHRFEQMLACAYRLGRMTRFTLVPKNQKEPAPAPHRTNMLFHFRIACEGQWKHEQLIETCVDLTDGCIRPEISQRLRDHEITEALPKNIEPEKIEVTEAWHIAREHVTQSLRAQDDGWARESLLVMARERCILDRFFPDADDDSNDALHQHHLSELERRTKPLAYVRTRLAAMVFAQYP
ncbi:MAG: YqhG family protein [Limnochordia bacterium]|jgi:hypothetical protein